MISGTLTPGERAGARSGNARVRRGMIQLAWRFLLFQKNSALAQWFRARTENARGTRKLMIVALARKLLIARFYAARLCAQGEPRRFRLSWAQCVLGCVMTKPAVV